MRRAVPLLFGLALCALSGTFHVQAAGLPVEEASIADVQAAYLAGRATAVDIVKAHLDRIAACDTGGSSGGPGAALASGFGIVGIGTDTGGSVRMPSAHNALAGLRPTVGLVSRSGVVPLDGVRDTAGPMARSVTDMAILLDVI